jgi:predicted secreted protein
MITLDNSFNGKKILTQKGNRIKVQLAENATTGYLWKINSLDEKHLHFTEKEYEISGEAVGAGGMRTFYIEVINKGISELLITLGNPWENDTIDTFRVTIES